MSGVNDQLLETQKQSILVSIYSSALYCLETLAPYPSWYLNNSLYRNIYKVRRSGPKVRQEDPPMRVPTHSQHRGPFASGTKTLFGTKIPKTIFELKHFFKPFWWDPLVSLKNSTSKEGF